MLLAVATAGMVASASASHAPDEVVQSDDRAAGVVVHQVPMRDGTKLNTIVYLPEQAAATKKLATVLIRTPYNAEGLVSENQTWCPLGFALVTQDVRGMYASEGEFRMFHDVGYDGYDTIAWITDQPWSNGRVGQTGASALAIATYNLMTAHDPAPPVGLQAVAPIVGNAAMHKASFQGGAWRLSLMAGWLDGQKGGSPWIPREIAHEGFSDYSSNVSGYYKTPDGVSGFSRARKAAVPGVHQAGWYDIFSWSQIETVHQLNGSWPGPMDPPVATAPHWLVVVPGGHCGGGATNWTNISFGNDVFGETMETLFMLKLTDPESGTAAELQRKLDQTPRVTFFMPGPGYPGSVGNYWVQRDSFPHNDQVAAPSARTAAQSTAVASKLLWLCPSLRPILIKHLWRILFWSRSRSCTRRRVATYSGQSQTLIQMLLMCSRTIRLTRCKPGAGTIWWPQCVHNTRPRVCAFVCFSLEKFQEIKLPMDCRFDLMSLSHNLSRSIHTSVGRKTSARWRQGARTCCNTSALHCLHVVYWYCSMHVHNAAYIMLWLACCRYPTLAGHPIAIVGNVTVDLFVGTVRFFARQRKKDISISASGSPSH